MINKEALEYVADLALGNVEVMNVEGQEFSAKQLNLIAEPTASAIVVSTLTGLADYLINNYDNLDPVLLQVVSPTEVKVLSNFNRDMRRNVYVKAEALLPDIRFERFMDVENFNIMLQSCFVPTEHSKALLSIVGNLREENVKNTGDDGVTQNVTVKSGITTVAEVAVPNPVELKPFRTFIDVSQPACSFVFRMKDGPSAALFEADGGAWKLQAMSDIKDFLQHALSKQIEDGFVTIIS